jgi:hypothetical protein
MTTTATATATVINLLPTENDLWNDVKAALDRIERHGDDALNEWVTVGLKLDQIRRDYPQLNSGAYTRAARKHDIFLNANQMSAARWWALLSSEFRDKLHADFPDVFAPAKLQDHCREHYPNQAKIKKSSVSLPEGNGRKSQNKAKSASLEPDRQTAASPKTDTAEPTISKAQRKKLAEDVAREELREEYRRKRERREKDLARRTAEDIRPKLAEQPVIMFGVQMWPVSDTDRHRLGYYDYDQLFFGIHQFNHWRWLLHEATDHASRSTTLRERFKATQLFVERRLTGECQTEMKRFLAVMRTLADLYRANPTGECRPPSDICLH